MIGKKAPASYTNIDALVDGDVAQFDQNRQLLTTAAKAAEATSLYVGVCKGKVKEVNPTSGALEDKANIEFPQEI